MGRKPRVHYNNAIFHVFSRGNNKQVIFVDDSDRQMFLHSLISARKLHPFKLYAFCLMSNHFHLLIQVERYPLSRIMQALLTRYSRRFNIKHGRVGHLFQNRFNALVCRKDSYFLELLRYIHLNPVRAGMVKKADEWPWSSHQYYIQPEENNIINRKYPLSLFNTGKQAVALYEQFIAEGLNEASQDCYPLPPIEENSLSLIESINLDSSELSSPAMTLDNLTYQISKEHKISSLAIRSTSRNRSVCAARRQFIQAALKEGYVSIEIAKYLKRSSAAIRQAFHRAGTAYVT